MPAHLASSQIAALLRDRDAPGQPADRHRLLGLEASDVDDRVRRILKMIEPLASGRSATPSRSFVYVANGLTNGVTAQRRARRQ